jgi:hypothetical protein
MRKLSTTSAGASHTRRGRSLVTDTNGIKLS